jgi:hypothetical protein
MSPKIGPRRRPRKRSHTYHRFWWWLAREAALRVIYPSAIGTAAEAVARKQLIGPDTHRIRALAELVLQQYPARRHWPGDRP